MPGGRGVDIPLAPFRRPVPPFPSSPLTLPFPDASGLHGRLGGLSWSWSVDRDALLFRGLEAV